MDQPPPTPRGLPNLNNTCFANALAQAVHAVPQFRAAVLEQGAPAAQGAPTANASTSTAAATAAAQGLQAVFRHLGGSPSVPRTGGGTAWDGRAAGAHTKPRTRKQKLAAARKATLVGGRAEVAMLMHAMQGRFQAGRQHDSFEFAQDLLARVAADHDGNARRGTNPASVFAGVAVDSKRCARCSQETSADTRAFNTLTVPLPLPVSQHGDSGGASTLTPTPAPVSHLVRAALSAQAMDADSKVHCAHCGTDELAVSWVRVDEPPAALLVQLERHRLSPGQGGTAKITSPVELEESITIRTGCDQGARAMYSLVSVISHIGMSPRSGHYTADVRLAGASAQAAATTNTSTTPRDPEAASASTRRAATAEPLFATIDDMFVHRPEPFRVLRDRVSRSAYGLVYVLVDRVEARPDLSECGLLWTPGQLWRERALGVGLVMEPLETRAGAAAELLASGRGPGDRGGSPDGHGGGYGRGRGRRRGRGLLWIRGLERKGKREEEGVRRARRRFFFSSWSFSTALRSRSFSTAWRMAIVGPSAMPNSISSAGLIRRSAGMSISSSSSAFRIRSSPSGPSAKLVRWVTISSFTIGSSSRRACSARALAAELVVTWARARA